MNQITDPEELLLVSSDTGNKKLLEFTPVSFGSTMFSAFEMHLYTIIIIIIIIIIINLYVFTSL